MKKIIYSLLFLFTSSVFASDPPVVSCLFTGNIPGVLATSPIAPSIFGSTVAGGSPAQLYINYTGSPSLTVQSIDNFTSAPGIVPSSSTFNTNGSLMYNGEMNGGVFWQSGPVTKILSNVYTNDVLSVDFLVRFRGGSPVSGSYSASTTVTCQ